MCEGPGRAERASGLPIVASRRFEKGGFGAGSGGRTHKSLRTADFKSAAFADFAIPARFKLAPLATPGHRAWATLVNSRLWPLFQAGQFRLNESNAHVQLCLHIDECDIGNRNIMASARRSRAVVHAVNSERIIATRSRALQGSLCPGLPTGVSGRRLRGYAQRRPGVDDEWTPPAVGYTAK